MAEINFIYYDDEENNLVNETEEIGIPRICMHCHNTGEQVTIIGVEMYGEEDKDAGVIVTACPFCSNTSFHYLELIDTGVNGHSFLKIYRSEPPMQNFSLDLPKNIQDDFKEFSEIYTQSITAEDNGLDQLAGMGLRKSIEFLVTDYLIQYPVDGVSEEWLKDPKTMLSEKISKIEKKRTRDIAKAITYLGNDETHYTRRHPEYDIQSIKLFIKALISDIENEIAYQEVEKLIKKPNDK